MANKPQKSSAELVFQLLFTFALPLIALTRFSSESTLGPTGGLLLALSFPVIYEMYSIVKNKKLSWISVVSIGGILVTGSISLLHLSVEWLALRRSIPYIFVSLGILIAERVRYSPAEKVAEKVLNLEKVRSSMKNPDQKLRQLFKKCSYLGAFLFGGVAIVSYALTRIIITSPLDTAVFNQQYAQLRLWSIAAVTVPLLVGSVAIIWFLINRLEKETNLDVEAFMNK